MPAIDFHTHVQPSAEEGIAFQQQWGYARPARNGTPAELLPRMDACGLERALMVPWLPAQDYVDRRMAARARAGGDARLRAQVVREVIAEWQALNQWAVDQVRAQPERLSCLVGLDPLLMDASTLRGEVRDKLAQGACGLKIAPLFLRCPPDDPRVGSVFDLAAEHGVFVLSQAGAHGYADQPDWGHPRYFEAVLRNWPTVDVQLAHLGRGGEAEVARLTAQHPNLYADTSARLHEIDQPGGWSADEAVEWLRRIGIDRVVFGTNYPMYEPAEFLQVVQTLPLRDAERERILYGNASGLLARSRPPAAA